MKKTIYIFDFDDTLIKTTATIHLYNKDNQLVRKIPTDVYNAQRDKSVFLTEEGMYFTFTDFNSFEVLKHEETTELFEEFRELTDKEIPVAIVTSREYSDIIRNFLSLHNIHRSNSNFYIFCTFHCTSHYHGNDAERKLQVLEDLYRNGYNDFIIYDDALVNITEMKKLEELHADVTVTIGDLNPIK